MKKFVLGSSKESILNMVPDRSIKKVLIGEKPITLVRVSRDFYAFQGFCPHRGAPLFEGSLNVMNEIICPLHQYRFDIKTGEVMAGSCGDLELYPTTLTENGLEIFVPQ